MMTANLFVIANVKQLWTDSSFIILLPFFWTSWGVGILTSAIFNSFHNRVEFGTILERRPNFGGGFEHPNTLPSVRHCTETFIELKYLCSIRNTADYLIVSPPSVHNL